MAPESPRNTPNSLPETMETVDSVPVENGPEVQEGSEGTQEGSAHAEIILKEAADALREKHAPHGKEQDQNSPTQEKSQLQVKSSEHASHAKEGVGEGIMNATKAAGSTFFAILGFFGALIWQALKSAPEMMGKGGGGHSKKDDHGGGHH